ncbi:hypothetical protein H6P81_016063 [Aristolochia fimbriata]|uniref:Uncharacterized protein n=1 Tax=Aristolochia fimbriata TaxID=158543 RepID=A0AAV7EBW1_ARIFI|nr:hypothetical protein H6P81_016063 [Aristolochia fimbriata]
MARPADLGRPGQGLLLWRGFSAKGHAAPPPSAAWGLGSPSGDLGGQLSAPLCLLHGGPHHVVTVGTDCGGSGRRRAPGRGRRDKLGLLPPCVLWKGSPLAPRKGLLPQRRSVHWLAPQRERSKAIKPLASVGRWPSALWPSGERPKWPASDPFAQLRVFRSFTLSGGDRSVPPLPILTCLMRRLWRLFGFAMHGRGIGVADQRAACGEWCMLDMRWRCFQPV